MKYVIRRAIVSAILSPAVVIAYVIFYAVLVGLGAQPGDNVEGVIANGWLIAFAVGVVFTFWTQIQKLVGGTK
jgi:hypothetical protein